MGPRHMPLNAAFMKGTVEGEVRALLSVLPHAAPTVNCFSCLEGDLASLARAGARIDLY